LKENRVDHATEGGKTKKAANKRPNSNAAKIKKQPQGSTARNNKAGRNNVRGNPNEGGGANIYSGKENTQKRKQKTIYGKKITREANTWSKGRKKSARRVSGGRVNQKAGACIKGEEYFRCENCLRSKNRKETSGTFKGGSDGPRFRFGPKGETGKGAQGKGERGKKSSRNVSLA